MGEINYGREDLLEEAFWQPKWYQRIALNTLKCGVLPKHIAVIMDGNRRWAVERGLQPIYGHIQGVKTFDLCFHWMETIGIRELTVFAFSPDNFKRDKTEVKQLMDLFSHYLQHILDKEKEVNERGYFFTIYGGIDLLPSKLRALAAKVILNTRHNKTFKVNLAIGYKASDEMDLVLETLSKAVADGDLLPGDIDETVIERCMYTADGSSPDLLIRTSGEKRYSDFYMWQLMRKPLFFCGGKWPDFSFGNFCRAIHSFQRYFANCDKVQSNYDGELKRESEKTMSDADRMARDARVQKYFEKKERLYVEYLRNIVNEEKNKK